MEPLGFFLACGTSNTDRMCFFFFLNPPFSSTFVGYMAIIVINQTLEHNRQKEKKVHHVIAG